MGSLLLGRPLTWVGEDRPSWRPDRLLPDWMIAAVFAATVLVAGLWLLASGMNLTHEDGFYYFKIAQHVARPQPVTPASTTLSFGDCANHMQPLLVDDRYQASWRIEAYFVDGGDPGP